MEPRTRSHSPPSEDDPAGAGGGLRFGLQPYFGPLKFTPMKEFLSNLAEQIETSSGACACACACARLCVCVCVCVCVSVCVCVCW